MINKLIRWLTRFHGDASDFGIIAGDLTLVYNHPTKVALLFDPDPNMPDDRYVQLEQHLSKQGYILQVIVASRQATLPSSLMERGIQ